MHEEIIPNATPATTRVNVNDCGSGDDSGGNAGAHPLHIKLTAGPAVGKNGEADAAVELSASAENEFVAIARETCGKEAAALLVSNRLASKLMSRYNNYDEIYMGVG